MFFFYFYFFFYVVVWKLNWRLSVDALFNVRIHITFLFYFIFFFNNNKFYFYSFSMDFWLRWSACLPACLFFLHILFLSPAAAATTTTNTTTTTVVFAMDSFVFLFLTTSIAEGLISTETFCRIFPFHVMFDRHMQIVQVGKSVSRIIPR